MGWLGRSFGSDKARNETTLRDVALALGIDAPTIKSDSDDGATLRATWKGCTLALVFDQGIVRRCTLKYPVIDTEVELFYEDSARNGNGKVVVGDHVVCAKEYLESFSSLAEPLRVRLIEGMRKYSLHIIRSMRTEHTLDFTHDAPISFNQLVGALTLSMELCLARGHDPERRIEKRGDVITPLRLAKQFAKRYKGAQVEDTSMDSAAPMHAFVKFEHGDSAMRLAFYRVDATTCNVWLETKAAGIVGSLGLMRVEGDQFPDLAPNEKRVFLSKRCYVQSERAEQELARVLSLPAKEQEQLLELGETYKAVTLEEELLSIFVGDIFEFDEALKKGAHKVPFLAPESERLAGIARAFPVQSDEFATRARAVECTFCSSLFVLAPGANTCSRCGAPAQLSTLNADDVRIGGDKQG